MNSTASSEASKNIADGLALTFLLYSASHLSKVSKKISSASWWIRLPCFDRREASSAYSNAFRPLEDNLRAVLVAAGVTYNLVAICACILRGIIKRTTTK